MPVAPAEAKSHRIRSPRLVGTRRVSRGAPAPVDAASAAPTPAGPAARRRAVERTGRAPGSRRLSAPVVQQQRAGVERVQALVVGQQDRAAVDGGAPGGLALAGPGAQRQVAAQVAPGRPGATPGRGRGKSPGLRRARPPR